MPLYFKPLRMATKLPMVAMIFVSLWVIGCQSNSQQASSDKNSPQVADATPNVSASAQTSGVFTAWTDPEQIVPMENFRIIVAIRLPAEATHYTPSDLSGEIKGSDNYRQKIAFKSVNEIPIINGFSEVQILVPGTVRETRTEITIQSKLLGQTATFTFKAPK